MNRDEVVRLENVWKRFGYRTALSGIDLVIPSGQCVALLGPNGAGKSTLLRILSTRTRPTSGRVEVFGCDILRRSLEVRGKIGVVFHETFLRGDLSLEENLRYYSSLYGERVNGQRLDQLVERMGLEDRRRDSIREFSRGMKQRATLARSLLHDPALWLLDEPFTGLDPNGQILLEGLIEEEQRNGRTIVFVTHDVELGLRVADESVVLEKGELAARGREEVRQHFQIDRMASSSTGES